MLLFVQQIADRIEQIVKEFVRVLLMIVVEHLILFAQFGHKLFGRQTAGLLLLRGDIVKQIGQAGEQRLLVAAFVFRLVFEHLISKRFTEVERLQNAVTVACVAEVGQTKVSFVGRKLIGANLLL